MSQQYHQFPGPLGEALRHLAQGNAENRVQESATLRVAQRGPAGVQLEVKSPADAGGGLSLLSASVIAEGADALLCSTDGGATTFVVMKPEPLRLSRMLAYVGAPDFPMGEFYPTITQVMTQAVWDKWGYVINVKTNLRLPLVDEEDRVVWPSWVDVDTTGSTSTPVNQVRVDLTDLARSIIIARVQGCGVVNAADLREDGAGDTTVNHVDITPGRGWHAIDEVSQVQAVYDAPGGTQIGTVDNLPPNS